MNELIKMLSNSKKFNSYIEDFDKKKSPELLTRAYRCYENVLCLCYKGIYESKNLYGNL